MTWIKCEVESDDPTSFSKAKVVRAFRIDRIETIDFLGPDLAVVRMMGGQRFTVIGSPARALESEIALLTTIIGG